MNFQNTIIMKIDFITPFYKTEQDEDTLLQNVQSLFFSDPNIKASLFPIYIDSKLFNRFEKGMDGFKLNYKKDNVYLFDFDFKIKILNEVKYVNGKVFIIRNKKFHNVYSIISLEDSLFLKRGILPYFRRKYPLATLTFITHKKLKDLLIKFRDRNDFDLFSIVRTTTYSRIDQRFVPSISWPDFTLERAFEWAEEIDGWFQGLTLKIKKEFSAESMISISRNGILKTNNFMKPIYDELLDPISNIVFRNIEFFGNRSRLENKDRDVRPISIEFDEELFTNPEDNFKFIEAMRKMKASSLSIIHANPYVHISIFDYFDGSSFNIWVLSSNKIILVPQLKSSFQSIKRLINHIFDNYAEGEMRDLEVTY